MSTPANAPPSAYLRGVCADCREPVKESERPGARRCIKCGCQMHQECGMRDARGNEACERCFVYLIEPLPLEERTAVEDALAELDLVRKSLTRAIEKGTSRKQVHDLGELAQALADRVRAAGVTLVDASRLDPSIEAEVEAPTLSDSEGPQRHPNLSEIEGGQ